MKPVKSGRITRSYTQTIGAPPERVFPLLCPVREGEWLEGWAGRFEMVHSDCGLVEDGCVFRTRTPGGPETVWMVTRHEPAARLVEFVRVTTGLLATRLTLSVAPGPGGDSLVHVSYTFTPLGEQGRAFVEHTHGEGAFRREMARWEDSMNHWLRTGRTLLAAAE